MKRLMIILLILIALLSSAFSKTVLTLDGAIEIALERNEDVEKAREDYKKSEYEYDEAFAGALPTIDAKATYLRNIYSSDITNMNYASAAGIGETLRDLDLITQDTFDNYMGDVSNKFDKDVNAVKDNTLSLELNLVQPLYVGGKVMTAIDIAEIYEKLSRTTLELREDEVKVIVKKAFYNVLMLEEAVRVILVVKDDADRNLKNIENMYEAGLVSEYDLIKARVRVRSIEPDIIALKNNLVIAKNYLKSTLGMDLSEEIEVDGEFSENVVVDTDNYKERALDSKRELKLLGFQKEMYEKNVTIQKGDYLPSVFALGNYTFQSQNDEFGDTFEKNYGVHSASVGLMAQINLFDGFGKKARVDKANVELRKAELELQKSRRLIELQAEQTYRAIVEARDEIKARNEAILESEKALKISEVRFNNGLGTQLEVIDAQTSLEQARLNKIQAIHKLIVAKIEFEFATNGSN